jgi:hypothetical protein
MTTDNYINEHRTETFKKGDKVVMHTCMESKLVRYKDKEWVCLTDSYLDRGNQDVVFLEGFSGCFASKYLKKI